MPSGSQSRLRNNEASAYASMVDRLIREEEAAEMLGVSVRTLQAWRYRGGGPPYVRISSRCVRYNHATLSQWAAEHMVM